MLAGASETPNGRWLASAAGRSWERGVVTQGDSMAIAIPASICAAACYGLTAVLQHRATRAIPKRGALRPRLLLDLVVEPVWVASIGANIAGTVLQAVALRFGPLIMVQPLLVTGLLFTAVFGAAMHRHRPDRVLLAGAVCCVIGLAIFLVLAQPSQGRDTLSLVSMVPLVIALGVVVAGCLMASSRGHGLVPALAMALATGVLYGVTACFIKVVAAEFSKTPTAPLHGWALYALCVVGPVGFLLSQNAFQASPAASPILAVLTTVDPVVAIVVGRLWLGEEVHLGLLELTGQVGALAVMTAGIALLAQRAPHLDRRENTSSGRASTSQLGHGASAA